MILKNELLLVVKIKQGQVAELFKAVRLQKAMVFELDDQSIPEIDFRASTTSVVL